MTDQQTITVKSAFGADKQVTKADKPQQEKKTMTTAIKQGKRPQDIFLEDDARTDSLIHLLENIDENGHKLFMIIDTFNLSRDTNGNATGHFNVTLALYDNRGALDQTWFVAETGRQRQQIGYGRVNGAAEHALDRLGWEVDFKAASSDDKRKWAMYPVNVPALLQTLRA